MFAQVESYYLVPLISLSIVSIIACVFQIILKNKIQFLKICKVTVFLPLLSIIIKGLNGFASAYHDMAVANDISQKIWNLGLWRILSALSLSIFLTILLLIIYAITDTIIYNQSKN